MKSTGEVLGIGKTVNEALFKGASAAGISIKQPWDTEGLGVFISIENRDHNEIVSLANGRFGYENLCHSTRRLEARH